MGDVEKKFRPSTVQVLSDATAESLRQYLNAAYDILVPTAMHARCAVLWLVDEKGAIWFAAEEIVNVNTGEFVAVRSKANFGKIEGTEKLGHPALLAGANKNARIGGEILFDRKHNRWVINNSSGRYGIRPGQKTEHLVAVGKRFNEFGINLEVQPE